MYSRSVAGTKASVIQQEVEHFKERGFDAPHYHDFNTPDTLKQFSDEELSKVFGSSHVHYRWVQYGGSLELMSFSKDEPLFKYGSIDPTKPVSDVITFEGFDPAHPEIENPSYFIAPENNVCDHGNRDAKPSVALYNAMNIEANEVHKEMESAPADLMEGMISAKYNKAPISSSILQSYETNASEVVDEYETEGNDYLLRHPTSIAETTTNVQSFTEPKPVATSRYASPPKVSQSLSSTRPSGTTPTSTTSIPRQASNPVVPKATRPMSTTSTSIPRAYPTRPRTVASSLKTSSLPSSKPGVASPPKNRTISSLKTTSLSSAKSAANSPPKAFTASTSSPKQSAQLQSSRFPFSRPSPPKQTMSSTSPGLRLAQHPPSSQQSGSAATQNKTDPTPRIPHYMMDTKSSRALAKQPVVAPKHPTPLGGRTVRRDRFIPQVSLSAARTEKKPQIVQNSTSRVSYVHGVRTNQV